MGKATERSEYMAQHPLTPEELAARYPQVPELRLRADTPAVEVDPATRARDVMSRAQGEGLILLRDAEGGTPTVMIPAARYLELVGKELVNDPSKWESGANGVGPTADTLAAAHVEQVNSNDTWRSRGGL